MTLILKEMRTLCIETGGFTWWRDEDQFASTGFVVGVSVGDWRVLETSTPSESEIYEALRDLPSEPHIDGLGAWVDGDRTVFDPVALFASERAAMEAARTFGQTHIFNIGTGQVLAAA